MTDRVCEFRKHDPDATCKLKAVFFRFFVQALTQDLVQQRQRSVVVGQQNDRDSSSTLSTALLNCVSVIAVSSTPIVASRTPTRTVTRTW